MPILAISLALLLSSCTPPEKKIELKDEKAKASYSVGYQFGQNLKKMHADLDAGAWPTRSPTPFTSASASARCSAITRS